MAIKFIKKIAPVETLPPMEVHTTPTKVASPWLGMPASEYAEAYDNYGANSLGVMIPPQLHELRLKRAAELLKSCMLASDTLLDVGCGYGALVKYLPPAVHYSGMDPSTDFETEFKTRHPERQFTLSELGYNQAGETKVFDWVVCLGLATHLRPGIDHLSWFASELQVFAKKGILVEFQGANYKGKFTRHLPIEVVGAFHQRIKIEDMAQDADDTTYTVLMRVL
jgi:cyclopropane fatty-acyl-phospholipid synthase-like methyltransferase